MKTLPLGIYVVLPCDDKQIASRSCWTDPNIKGVVLRTWWSSVAPAKGTVNFSYFDTGMALCQQHGKFAMQQVNGNQAPQWLYQIGAKGFPLSVGGQTPAPWDAIVQEEWTSLVTAWGNKYDTDDLLTNVGMWVGGKAFECFFADNPKDLATLNALGGGPVWLEGAKVLLNAFNFFATTDASIAAGNAASDGNVTMTALYNYMIEQWGGGTIQSNALSTHFPSGTTFPHTTLDCSQIASIGFQLLQPMGNPAMAGTTLAQVLANALRVKAKWVQIYPNDPASDPGEQSIINFNKSVGA